MNRGSGIAAMADGFPTPAARTPADLLRGWQMVRRIWKGSVASQIVHGLLSHPGGPSKITRNSVPTLVQSSTGISPQSNVGERRSRVVLHPPCRDASVHQRRRTPDRIHSASGTEADPSAHGIPRTQLA